MMDLKQRGHNKENKDDSYIWKMKINDNMSVYARLHAQVQ